MPHGLKSADPLDLADAIRRRRQQVAQQGPEALTEPSPAQRNAGLLALEQLIDERVGAAALDRDILGRLVVTDSNVYRWSLLRGTDSQELFGVGQDGLPRTPLHAWKMFYTNASGIFGALALGTDGQVLRATGASEAPAFEDDMSTLGFVIDGGGATITTGVKGDLEVPFACTITSVTLLADQVGSIVVDIWKDTYANAPPTAADSITASAKPTLSSAQKSQDTTLTGWSKNLAAGDILRFNVDSAATVQRVSVMLKVKKT